jgi:RNA polymerase sigma-B factor
MGLAHCVATRQQQRGPEEHDDLLQEARLGLIQGMDNWDPSRGFRPSSYLMSRANGQVLHYRRDRSRMVRIPWRLQDLYVSGPASSAGTDAERVTPFRRLLHR